MRRNAPSDLLRDFRNGDEEDGQNFGIKRKTLSENDLIPKQNARINLHEPQPRRPRRKKRENTGKAASSSIQLQGDEEDGLKFGKGLATSDNDISNSDEEKRMFMFDDIDGDFIPKNPLPINLDKQEPRYAFGLGRLERRGKAATLKRQPIQAIAQAVSFGYEFYEGDTDQLTTVLPNSYIDPESLELNNKIGHGLFGDVWLATHHRPGKYRHEHHDVAVKMLYSMNQVHVDEFLHKFEQVWRNLKSKQLEGVCWLHGFSIISGQICIVYKWYKETVGDRIVRADRGKLPIQDVLRYGSELANGIQQLHQVGLLVLNLKPSNFLVDGEDIILGDFGIPYLLRGIRWRDPCMAMRLGTPNYMAPEQWEPGVRGPVSYETDSWGFACSMIKMITGKPPWFGRSTQEIRHAVVIRHEKPNLPPGLYPAVERILEACFEYDFRNRPLMPDISHILERVRKTVYDVDHGSGSEPEDNLHVNNGLTTWFLLKDHIRMGDTVRSRKDPNNQGVVVGECGLDKFCKRDKLVMVNMHTRSELNVSTLQRVTSGFASGDWVQLLEANRKHSSLGIVHHIQRDGTAAVGFLGLETLWRGRLSELKLVEDPFLVGQFVRLKANMSDHPQFEWPYKRCSGKISKVHPNGCLEVRFPGRFVVGDEGWLANPEEVEHVNKYEIVKDLHWGVKPIAFVLGLVAAAKIGALLGGSKRFSGIKKVTRNMLQRLPPKVANIIFNEESDE